MDGPEAGQTYTCQKYVEPSVGGTGAAISGCSEQSYLNWVPGEPNSQCSSMDGMKIICTFMEIQLMINLVSGMILLVLQNVSNR